MRAATSHRDPYADSPSLFEGHEIARFANGAQAQGVGCTCLKGTAGKRAPTRMPMLDIGRTTGTRSNFDRRDVVHLAVTLFSTPGVLQHYRSGPLP